MLGGHRACWFSDPDAHLSGVVPQCRNSAEHVPCRAQLPFQPVTSPLLFCSQPSSGVPHRAWAPFSVPGGARAFVSSSPSHETAKATPGAWAPGEQGGVQAPHSHAFRPEAPPDTALQRPEQELLCHAHPPVGQQCYRVYPVGGKHGAGVPGGCGPEAGAA